ncbi:MAG: M24 family metallopeptidase [Pseudomonadota bacterium]
MFQNFEMTADKDATPSRLAAVRKEMADAGVTGFLVPRADAHQGENVAPHDERLAWVTGFTGSAGIAVIFDRRAAIFTDGRYTLQTAEQVKSDLYELVPIHVTPVHEWMPGAIQAGDRIGYDPWLHGKSEIDHLRKVAEAHGAELVSLAANPLDAAWQDQPPKPAGAVRIHNEYAGEDTKTKRTRLGEALTQAGASSAILSLPDSLAWLLNIRGSDIGRSPVAQGFGVLHADGHVDLVMDPDKIDGDVRTHLGNDVTIHPVDALPSVVDNLSGSVLLDRNTCPLWFAERLAAASTEMIWGRDPCILPKAQKNSAELDGMRMAHLRDGAAMVTFLCWVDQALASGETLTEIDIAMRLEEIRAEGGDLHDISFETICGSGPNGALPHYRVNRESNRTLMPGELLLVDSGGQYPDGTTDITRTMATGPVSAEHKRHFTLVLKGMISVSRIRWPEGLNGRDLDPLARAALWRAGLDYDHGTGHGVGACLNVHEGPASLSRRGTEPLLPGMILSNEPGYYVEGAYGIRIENLVIVTEPSVPDGGNRQMLGFETLTFCPIDQRLIDPNLLDHEEIAWLDDYHTQVEAKIGAFLDGAELEWLEHACRPLNSTETPEMSDRFTIEPAPGTVVVRAGGAVIAESNNAMILRENGYDPVFYLPRADAGMEFLEPSDKVTHCPHKGDATHFHVVRKSTPIENGAWSYENPFAAAEAIKDHIAFYPNEIAVEQL